MCSTRCLAEGWKDDDKSLHILRAFFSATIFTANRENNHHVDKRVRIKVLLIGTSKQTGVATLINSWEHAHTKLGFYQNPKASGKVRDPFYSIPYFLEVFMVNDLTSG